MRVFDSLQFYFPALAFRRSTLPMLREVAAPDVAERVWRKTLEQQKRLRRTRPRYSLGLNLMLRYMEWDCALYRASREEGITESSAKAMIEKINWAAFGPMTKTSFQLSRLRRRHLLPRIKWVVDLMFLIIFTTPFRRNIHSTSNAVAFDVVVCPLAQYFKDQGVPELTLSAACSLDYQMANDWGVTLHRTQTIAAGDPLCNFQFREGVEIKKLDQVNHGAHGEHGVF
jgi:L-2-amino-thiazoline-4-carboxylic acid hydrolase